MAVPPVAGYALRANSHFHDEDGFTTEEAGTTRLMQEKLLAKERSLAEGLRGYGQVKVHGNRTAGTALLSWGSNAGVCREVAETLGIRAVQPIVLWPFPREQLSEALAGTDRVIAVENNATGQFATLCRQYGIVTAGAIRKYDGRPFFLDELTAQVQEVLP
jgi:2-oxoglutarate ferredoxin oxidoreductase subunit alpha